MDDAAQRRQLRVDARQHRVDGGGVGHVGQLDLDAGARFAQRFDGLRGLGVGIAAPVQDDGARAVLRHPGGHGDADAAQPARHEVGAVGPQPPVDQRRRRQDDLAQVPRRSHEAERGARLGQRPAAVNDRPQFARGEPRHDVAQHDAHPLRLGLLEHVEFQDVIGHVGAQRRHLLVAQDVPAGHLDEAAAGREAGQAGLDEPLAGEAVEHHVHALAAGGREDLLAEVGRAAVEDVLDAERAQIGLLRGAGRGEHFRARGLRQLDGRQPDPAGAGVDEHPLARRQPREAEGQLGRDEGAGNGGQPRDGDALGRGRDEFLVRDHLLREGAEAEAHDVVAYGHGGDLGADGHRVAAQLAAQVPLLDEAERAEHVPEVEPRRLHRDAHLPRLQGARGQRFDLRLVEHAGAIGRQHPLGLVGQLEPLGRGAGPHEARRQTPAAAVGDVVLLVGVQQLIDEAGQGRGFRGVQIEHPRLQMGRLEGHDLAQAPERRAGDLPAPLPLHHLRPARQEPDALGRGQVGVGDGLHQRQRARRRPRHVLGDLRRRRVLAVAVEPSHMHDAAERHVAGQCRDQRLPRLAVLRVDAHRNHAGAVGRRVVSGR